MKIALIGYGKMGKEIEKIALAADTKFVSIIDVDNQEDFESAASRARRCHRVHQSHGCIQ